MDKNELRQDAPGAYEVEVHQPQDDAQAVIDEYGIEEHGAIETPVETEYQPTGREVEERSRESEFEHKYKVLKGKYDKEVPRLHKEIKRLKKEKEELLARIGLLEQVVMQLRNDSARQAPQQKVEEEDDELKKFKEDYPDLYNAIYKLVERKIKPVESKVDTSVDKVNKDVALQAFYTKLDVLVPDWRELNEDPDFLDWLSEPAGDTGFTRHQLMLMAFNNLDAGGVAKWFMKYKESSGGQRREPEASRNVVPHGRKTSYQSKETSKRIFTESEIKKFYTDLALGKIPPDRAKEIENAIIDALMEDRVIYGK